MDNLAALERTLAHAAWRMGELSYKLDSLQRKINAELREKNPKRACVLSSRRIGKSHLALVRSLEFLIQNPGSVVRYIAETLDQAQKIVEGDLTHIIDDAPPGFIKHSRSLLRWELSNGSCIFLGGMAKAHVNRNRGVGADYIVFDEIGFVKSDDFNYARRAIFGPMLATTRGRELYISSPSLDIYHPLHTSIVPECITSGSFYKNTLYDCPRFDEITIQEIIDTCGGVHTEDFRREFLAEIIRPESMMVVPFNITDHVGEFITDHRFSHNIVIDWGGVRDKTCGLLVSYDFFNDKDIILDEFSFPPNTPTSAIVQSIRAMIKSCKYPIRTIFADVPGQIQVDLHHEFDIQISPPAKTDWLGNVGAMGTRFVLNKILINPRCQFLIKSCLGGMFNQNRTDFMRSDDLGHCDALACLMYAIRCQDKRIPEDITSYKNINNTSVWYNNKQEIKQPKRFGIYR
jgi:hypothetical protein